MIFLATQQKYFFLSVKTTHRILKNKNTAN